MKDTSRMMIFEETWQEAPLRELPAKESKSEKKTIICFLSNPDHQKEMVETAKAIDPNRKIVFIGYKEAHKKPEAYKQNMASVRKKYGNPEAILYLWPLEEPELIRNSSPIVYFLQAAAATGLIPKRILLAGQFANKLDRCYLDSWIGFERSRGMVMPNTELAVIHQDQTDLSMTDWTQKLLAELNTETLESVLYQNRKRYCHKLIPAKVSQEKSKQKQNETWLITGGCGGLGLIFAKHLAETRQANLILTGRSPLKEKQKKIIKELEKQGEKVLYLQSDISSGSKMEQGIADIKKEFKKIDGVIHAAGQEGTKSIFESDSETFQAILNPKVMGTLIIDELFRENPPELICYFSSSAAVLGDFGSCAYSVGNRFQMAYARYQEENEKSRKIAINWPLWKDGGMGQVNTKSVKMYLQLSGLRLLEKEEGLEIFDRLIYEKRSHTLLITGEPDQVEASLNLTKEQFKPEPKKTEQPSEPKENPSAPKEKRDKPPMAGLTLEQRIDWELKEQIADVQQIPQDRLKPDETLANYGFDSISLSELATRLTERFTIDVTPSLFYGYPTIKKLVDYFKIDHIAVFKERYQDELKSAEEPVREPSIDEAPDEDALIQPPKLERVKRGKIATQTNSQASEAIAIIGMSGRFPAARTVDAMWEILKEGKEVVGEIPKDRFDWQSCYCDFPATTGKTYGKWCGSLPGVREFDPLFFEISPRDAELMDPKQRLLLQECWNALENAGYGKDLIESETIGVFVGVEEGDYKQISKSRENITANHNGVLPARLPYFLNCSGPVLSINTACSSGLVAAHEAVLSLRAGECDAAIVGGVSLALTVDPYIAMSQAGMLSPEGKCRTFDQNANGMVPGEAVAVVMLKPLAKAEQDGNTIYATILGSGLNYDGKTNGITAPNGVAQAQLLTEIYKKNRIHPESIEYIVTHGTGTKLGDPVEVNALRDVFEKSTKKEAFCALTSTKTNFGHTLAASGLVGIITLLQSFRHETIPASLHCKQENEYIRWNRSPFYVNKSNRPWPNLEGKERIGAVSAFGMSGTNAHMVLQSYSMRTNTSESGKPPYYLLALSAKTDQALRDKIKQMAAFLSREENQNINLSQLSHTLLEGRQHFNRRCVIIVRDLEEAVTVWKRSENEKLPNLFWGTISRDFTEQKAIARYASELLEQCRKIAETGGDTNKYSEACYALADLYCQGYSLPWNRLYGTVKPTRIPLPTYPFTKDHYWISDEEANLSENSGTAGEQPHPLLHRNSSTFNEYRFSSTLDGSEFRTGASRQAPSLFPGVAWLEMAHAAVMLLTETNKADLSAIQLKDIAWSLPLAVTGQSIELHTGLACQDSKKIVWEIYSNAATEQEKRTVHGQGYATQMAVEFTPNTNLEALRNRLPRIDHDNTIPGIESIHLGTDQILAEYRQPATITKKTDACLLHPALLDSALMVSGLLTGHSKVGLLPFSLRSLEIHRLPEKTVWILTRQSAEAESEEPTFDISLINEQGELCVQMREFVLNPQDEKVKPVKPSVPVETLMLRSAWIPTPAQQEEKKSSDSNEQYIILCELDQIDPAEIESQIKGSRCLSLKAEQQTIEGRFEFYTTQLFHKIQELLQNNPKEKIQIRVLFPANGDRNTLFGLSGLLKTAQRENPKLVGQIIGLESDPDSKKIVNRLIENEQLHLDQQIQYLDGKRFVAGWHPIKTDRQPTKIPWRSSGVYLLTGGTGGLGILFAQEILKQTENATLILTGRAPLDQEKSEQLKALNAWGGNIEFIQADVTEEASVSQLIDTIQNKYGQLHGVIHSAGVVRDNFIIKKSVDELQQVMAPKLTGLLNLDRTTQELKLDFFILFSSITGWFGNPGQADYAAANAFMDAYASYRNTLVNAGKRHGNTLSINWPLWKEGGMRIDEEMKTMMTENTGMIPLQTKTGIQALYKAMATQNDQVLVMEGNAETMRNQL